MASRLEKERAAIVRDQRNFTLGYVYAATSIARMGYDTAAYELLMEVTRARIKDIKELELAPFDLEPLLRVIRLHRGTR